MAKLLNASAIREAIADKRAEAEAIVAAAEKDDRDMTDDEQAAFDAIVGRGEKGTDGYVAGVLDALDVDLGRAVRREEIQAEMRQAAKLQASVDRGDITPDEGPRTITVPARAKAARNLRAFRDERDAYVAGNVILAGLFGNAKARAWVSQNGFGNTMVEGINTKGGFLVPEEMQRTLIRLREERGIFSRYARNYPMGSDSFIVPRPINDVTAYWAAEGAEITASDADLGGAELVAKKLAALTKVSTELDEDSVVDIGDMITQSMAYALADKIDLAGFLGDGTSTYGGFTGLANALDTAAVNTAATGNVSAATLDLADWEATAALLPEYAGSTNVWFMHKSVYYNSVVNLLNALGGTSGLDVSNGMTPRLFGYDVVFTQVMPSNPGVSTKVAYFGDLSLAATLGTRRGVTTQVSVDRYFENDLIGIKATERCAVLVHERGDTVRTRPIVALETAAS